MSFMSQPMHESLTKRSPKSIVVNYDRIGVKFMAWKSDWRELKTFFALRLGVALSRPPPTDPMRGARNVKS